MALWDVLAKIVGFLRAGYPEGVPDGEYIALVAYFVAGFDDEVVAVARADFDGRRAFRELTSGWRSLS